MGNEENIGSNKMEKEVILNCEKDIEEYYQLSGIKVKGIDEQLEDLVNDIIDLFIELAKEEGGYTGDSIKVNVKMEYMPENK